jgi:tetratricopeptide (TPR) repeat protein
MKTRHVWLTLLGAFLALAAAGCGPGAKVVSERDQKQAAQLASEAEFAASLREWPRAEKLFAEAARIDPDAAYHMGLGSVRARQGNRAGAKDAYEAALRASERESAREPADSDRWIRRAYMLALLGKPAEGRALLQEAAKRLPQDRRLRAFLADQEFDALLAAPAFRQIAL